MLLTVARGRVASIDAGTTGEAREVVAVYATWPCIQIDPPLILDASDLEERYQLAFWDALVVEAARRVGATRLMTEDLQHGQSFGGVRIENPFL